MNFKRKILRPVLAAFVACAMTLSLAVGCAGNPEDEEGPIQSVHAIGFVDKDGAKVSALAIEYEEDMSGADISADTYKLRLHDDPAKVNLGSGNLGDITNWYVNDKPETKDGATKGSGSGKYVILEVYTDYLMSAESSFVNSMSTYVTQIKDITLPDGTVIEKGTEEATNATVTKTVDPTTGKTKTTVKLETKGFTIPDIEGFKFYTDEDPNGYGKDGDGFHLDGCFNQQDGKYYDVSLSYALWVPDDWHEDGNYAMVTLQNPAASAGTHPLVSVLQTRSPALYASDWAQNYVKEEHGVDGMIVLVPVVTQRVNDNVGTPAEYEAIVALWDKIIDEYSVNENYVYGSGQSVGGMILIETQRHRDNFFAGLLLYDDQWAQSYFVDTLFVRNMASVEATAAKAEMHYPRTTNASETPITWDFHYGNDGEKVYVEDGHDPYNLYYLASDDNMLVVRNGENYLSRDNWNEMSFLYQDLTGEESNGLNQKYLTLSSAPTKAILEEENETIENFLSDEANTERTTRNINTITFTEGGNGYSLRMYDATYEWLLSQSRTTEMNRDKLDLNKPFVAAETQIQDETRELHFKDPYSENQDGPLYFITGQQGAGTQFYNTGWYNLLKIADEVPGWLPDGMGSWTDGAAVTGSTIQSVQLIDGGKAVAIEYSEDMSNLYVNLKGDPILCYGSTTEYRKDITYALDPFTFYDGDGKEIACTIKNVYVNSSAAVASGLDKGEGSGKYIIVELESAIDKPEYLLQRTTLHTDKYIASAYTWHYNFS